jgi:hypothetical protein
LCGKPTLQLEYGIYHGWKPLYMEPSICHSVETSLYGT